jgi:3-methylcrotonyl-CoA carboxylase alpha subunit
MTDKIVSIGQSQTELTLDRDGMTFRAGEHVLEILDVRNDELEIRVGGRLHVVPYLVQGSNVSFVFDGETYETEVTDKGARTKARHRDHSTSAPMPGVVLKILANAGDEVAKGTPLLILEAMKMEHQIVAPRDGTIAAVNCREGELVQPGIELVTMKES